MGKFNLVYNGVEYTDKFELNKKLIIDSIQKSFEEHPQYHKTQILTTSVYRILYSIFVDEKKNIFLDAPTGTGKSIIGYMIHYCYYWINNTITGLKYPGNEDLIENNQTTYTLTSSKILQEQLESDFIKFDMEDHFTMLKGMSNYECSKGTKESNTYVGYNDRVCKGMKIGQIENLECFPTCEYIQRRMKAASSPSAVINYAYFLTIMNARFSPYFAKRDLVIADEGHLVPQIVTGMFNIDLNLFKLNKINKVFGGILFNFGSKLANELSLIEKEILETYNFFTQKDHTITEIIDHIRDFNKLCNMIINLMGVMEKNNPQSYPAFHEMWKKDFSDIEDKIIKIDYDKNKEYLDSLFLRPKDTFIEAQSIDFNSYNVGNTFLPNKEYYKYIIKDLSEAEVTKKYFLQHTKVCIFMSATIGDINEFGNLLGLDKSEFTGFNLPSTFDFEKSPIYAINSGYLNYNNFNTTIHHALRDCVKLVTQIHPNYGGVIHTSTFTITTMLKELLKRADPKSTRFLFYENSAEKDAHVATIRKFNGTRPYVIIGPSLYEGLDLKDDMGRLNIIIKTPYAGMDNYTKEKMKRFPFYYERETLEKIMQAIGRTNRHKNDWSVTYLLDSGLPKLIWKLPEYITSRMKNKKI